MKRFFHIICCAAGAGMMGCFVSRLDTVEGCVCFAIGSALLVGSIILASKKDEEDKTDKEEQ